MICRGRGILLRVSNYFRVQNNTSKIDPEGIQVLQIRQAKTNEMVEIPITLRANEVVQGLIKGELHAISNQKMNKYVKELC